MPSIGEDASVTQGLRELSAGAGAEYSFHFVAQALTYGRARTASVNASLVELRRQVRPAQGKTMITCHLWLSIP